MTPDKVEAALASLNQLSAAIACPDLPRRTRADESRWAATITEALSVLTEALAERDALRKQLIFAKNQARNLLKPKLREKYDAAMKETP